MTRFFLSPTDDHSLQGEGRICLELNQAANYRNGCIRKSQSANQFTKQREFHNKRVDGSPLRNWFISENEFLYGRSAADCSGRVSCLLFLDWLTSCILNIRDQHSSWLDDVSCVFPVCLCFFRVAHFELAVMDDELLGCDHV